MLHDRHNPRKSGQYWFQLLESIANDNARLRALRKVIIEFVYSCASCKDRLPDRWRVGGNRCSVCTKGSKEWKRMLRIYFEAGINLEVRYINASGGVEGHT